MSSHRKAFLFAIGTLLTAWFGPMIPGCGRAFTTTVGYAQGLFWFPPYSLIGWGGTGGFLLGLAGVCGAVLAAAYGGARLWFWGSSHFRWSLVGVAVLAVLVALGNRSYQRRIDWTSRGLNPDRPGFKPPVVILAGTFEYRIEDQLINQIKSGNALFEIRMRGFDHYYCRKWKGHDWRVGSWFRVEIAVKDSSYSWGLSMLPHTTRGIGSGGQFPPDNVVLARRLWQGDEFVGALPEALESETDTWGRKEEFSDLMKVGSFLIPRKIRFTEGERRIETFTVKKVEFAAWPSEEWFQKIKAKYAERDSELRAVDLGEPGVFPGRR